jgi:hypothetical protein
MITSSSARIGKTGLVHDANVYRVDCRQTSGQLAPGHRESQQIAPILDSPEHAA